MTIAIRSQLPNVIAILLSMGAAGELVGTPCLFLSQGQKGTFQALTEGTHSATIACSPVTTSTL